MCGVFDTEVKDSKAEQAMKHSPPSTMGKRGPLFRPIFSPTRIIVSTVTV